MKIFDILTVIFIGSFVLFAAIVVFLLIRSGCCPPLFGECIYLEKKELRPGQTERSGAKETTPVV